MDEVTLNTLTPGEKGIIARISASSGNTRQRLLEMGLTKGTPIELIRFAPMGDPMEIRVKGYRLSLRRLEAESIVVQKAAQ